ncbi:MAG TPA: hypothetical protein VJ483_01820 [Holophagaceae bacterium]|nr:hypothetical protein [Holophagaceae bacterium]
MSLEEPLTDAERRSETRWAAGGIAILACFALGAVYAGYKVLSLPPPAAAGPVDHGALPASVRDEAQALLAGQLDNARLEERWEEGRRDFHITGTPRNPLVSEFLREFKPLVAKRLMPLLQPYGELISFEIYNTDLPPARLRAFPPAPNAKPN